MTTIPAWAHKRCERCRQTIAYGQTPRKSKGNPVEVAVDLEPDSGGTMVVSVLNDVVYAGELPRSKAAAMRAAGVGLHQLHSDSCLKKSTSAKG